MSAVVCRKRPLFEDLRSSPPSGKRGRCGGSTINFSSPAPPSRTGSPGAVGAGSLEVPILAFQEKLEFLQKLFPGMETDLLAQTLESCDSSLDHAIQSLNGLRLSQPALPEAFGSVAIEEPAQTATMASASNIAGVEASTSSSMYQHGSNMGDASQDPASCSPSQPLGEEGWVDLVVREMMAASDISDARARAARVLDGFEGAVRNRCMAMLEGLVKENSSLKEAVQTILRDNHILKRAVQIQHERQLEHEQKAGELQRLKQLVEEYQEQVRGLQNSNYALSVHLQKAQQSDSIPGRFHPDVF